jgi:hypothetical protein
MTVLQVFIGIANLWHHNGTSDPTLEVKTPTGLLYSNMRYLHAVSWLLILKAGATSMSTI